MIVSFSMKADPGMCYRRFYLVTFALLLCFVLILLPGKVLAKACIGLVTSGANDLYWTYVKKGAQQAADELGYTLYFRGVVDEQSVDAQGYIIAEVEKAGCVGLIVAPNHQSREQDVLRLKNQGIPSVYIDRNVADSNVIAQISTDNFQAGRLAAIKMAEKIGEGGKVLVIRLDKTIKSTTTRVQGFIKGARESGIDIFETLYLGARVGEIRDGAKKYLAAHLERVDGIFTVNESTTLGILLSLPPTDNLPVFIGFDMRKEFKQAITQGVIQGTLVQNTYQMGFQSVYLINEYLNKQPWQATKFISLEASFVSK